ncbi:helix-turn-helix transcriptional regulator [Actinokineospora bangkokensis]|uniref:helix-turn-helix transcriptional regulator n=1 Tax=Actinokineospora bangkokensis TaxID=1193682 RepID=UPI000A0609D7|nr:LuxR C-terminal-related transcriptional regulator [Actinokineospora bangkokensis]
MAHPAPTSSALATLTAVPVAVTALDPVLLAQSCAALAGAPGIDLVDEVARARVVVVSVGVLAAAELRLIRQVRASAARPEVVVVAGEPAAADTLAALAAGARGLLRREQADAERLGQAVLSADLGDCTLPEDIVEQVPECDAPPTVHVLGPASATRDALVAALREAGAVLVPRPDSAPDTVTVVAGETVERALGACGRTGAERALVVAERFTPESVVRAADWGAKALLAAAEATPQRLLAALGSARDGDGRVPYQVMIRVLGAGTAEPVPAQRASGVEVPLTARQTTVLRLMAEGHGNGEIARLLECSEHTVKNVVYELMARLQVRNRAQAVAHAIRTGVI